MPVKTISFFLALLLGAAAFPSARTEDITPEYDGDTIVSYYEKKTDCPAISAKSGYLFCPESEEELFSLNADERLPMASTTKIMTGILAVELLDPDKIIEVDDRAVGTEGSSAYLMKGEKIAVGTLIYALMLQSANDAAAALAYETAGEIDCFADLMNKKAGELGLTDTHFTNPHGLDDKQHYTSARDLAKLTAYALGNETFAAIVATKHYSAQIIGRDTVRAFTNHNRLLFTYNGAIGVKTGYTMRTGRCLVSAARREGMTLICVTLCDRNDFADHARLLDFGFGNYHIIRLAGKNEISAKCRVTGGESDSLTVSNSGTVSVFTDIALTKDDFSLDICVPGMVFSPVSKGGKIGKINIRHNDNTLGYIVLYAENDIKQYKTPGFFERFFDALINYLNRIFGK